MADPNDHELRQLRVLLDKVAEETGATSKLLAELADAVLKAGLPDHSLMLASLAKRQAKLSYDCLVTTQPIPHSELRAIREQRRREGKDD